MNRTDNKKILLIGGVVAGSAIILAARFWIGAGFEKSTDHKESILKEALKNAQAQAAESYKEYQANKKGSDDSLATLKAKIEAAATEDASLAEKRESQKETPPASDETIKSLGEKLKTTQTEPETKQ